jgi:hypothetical protein
MKQLIEHMSGQVVTLAASAVRTSTAGTNGTTFAVPSHYKRWIVLLNITASAHETADYLDVYVDVSLDASKWLNAIHFTQHDGDAAAAAEYAILDPAAPGTAVIAVTSDATEGVVRPSAWGLYMRARWVIAEAGGDTDASHTFSVTCAGQP